MPSEAFWEDRYRTGNTGWDLGGPAPVLAKLLKENRPPGTRAAVPGCGFGHDVHLLASAGFEAWGFDFSDEAIRAAREAPAAKFVKADVFELPRRYAASFDFLWEYTCYCAIDPARRKEYVAALHDILAPGGELAALLFPMKEIAPGPPFVVHREEVDTVFAPRFDIVSIEEPRESVEHRRGLEILVRMKRKRT